MPLRKCEDCGRDVSTAAAQCPNCGRPAATESKPSHDISFGRGSLIGLAGSAILFVGVFSPALRLPMIGTQTFFTAAQGAGAIILALAIGAAVLTLLRRFQLMWVAGVAALATTAFTFYSFKSNLDKVQAAHAQLQGQFKEFADNPFKDMGIDLTSVRLEWGWAVLAAGAILICIAAFLGSDPDSGHERLLRS